MQTVKLDKYDQFLIRACKKEHSIDEYFYQIWKWRCGLPEDYSKAQCLVHVSYRLWTIIQELELASVIKVIDLLHREDWVQPKYVSISDEGNFDLLINNAISIIRFTECKKFPEMYWGVRWRNNS